MVVWIIGLSGSGKTTLAQEITSLLRQEGRIVALVDGDVIREIFQNDVDYSLEGRRRNANRICELCRFLEDQGILVICSILSIFQESRDWNRENFQNYFEVYIDAPVEQLISRDSKGLYSKYLRGEVQSVAGMDLDFPIPTAPDLTIKNDGNLSALLEYAGHITNQILGQNT